MITPDSHRRFAPVAVTALAPLTLALPARGAGDAGGSAWAGTRDTIAGVEVVRNPEAPLVADGAIVATAAWTATGAGSEDGDVPLWERPSSVRFVDGVVYILDRLAARVYAHRASDGIYLARVPFERAWFSFDAAGGRVCALERDPDTDLATLVAYSVEVPAAGVAEPDGSTEEES